MTDNKTFTTVQDLADYVIGNPRYSTRWILDENRSWQWVDAEAGKAWQTEENELDYVSYSDPLRAEYEVKDAELKSRRPEQEHVVSYSLVQAGDHYRPTHINLSMELGLQLKAIWTVRHNTYSETYVPLTIPGMLKRLGSTDIGAQVKDAQAQAKETSERNSRNYARHQARKLAQEILDLQTKNPDVVFPTQLTEIVAMEDEVE